jgi:hypothetical protein
MFCLFKEGLYMGDVTLDRYPIPYPSWYLTRVTLNKGPIWKKQLDKVIDKA